MKAVVIYEHGGIDKLIYDDLIQPNCKSNQIKIQMKATSINHLDLWIRTGVSGLPINFPMILGSDGSGTIVEVGRDITEYHVDDDVLIQPGTFCSKCHHCVSGKENYCLEYGILGKTQHGTQAEYIVVNPINIHLKPQHLTYEEAASMPLVYMTAYQMLIKRANLLPEDTVLIYGGSSGVGSAAIQISRELGAEVIATAGDDEKCKYSKKIGAHHVINHNQDNWMEEAKNITHGNGVNVVFEHIGSVTWENSLRILAKGGRIVTCGATSGSEVKINLTHFFMKQHSFYGSTMSDINSFNEVIHKIINNKYMPIVDKVFKMENVRLAHQYIEDRQQMGKVILVP
jgi:NADPH:quinone reductase-like Zn-dependent oxidoreductase